MNKPNEPVPPVKPKNKTPEREKRLERIEERRKEFFMDMPRAGARERARKR